MKKRKQVDFSGLLYALDGRRDAIEKASTALLLSRGEEAIEALEGYKLIKVEDEYDVAHNAELDAIIEEVRKAIAE